METFLAVTLNVHVYTQPVLLVLPLLVQTLQEKAHYQYFLINLGNLLPLFLIHHHDFGGGQPPPTTVPPVRPPGPQAGAQWAPPGDRTVKNGGGAEAAATCGGGGGGSGGEGFRSLREENTRSRRVPLPRESAHCNGR